MKERMRTVESVKELFFSTMIDQKVIRVRYDVGWIWFDIQNDNGNAWRGPKHLRFTLTTEDAQLLVNALQELLPKKDCGEHK